MSRFQMLGLLSAASQLQTGMSAKILMIGDSMVEYGGTALKDFCSGAEVYNAGIGGTTAVQWTNGLLDGVSADTCGGTSPDYVWLSVGGNDALETGCTVSKSDLVTKIKAAIAAVKAKYSSAGIVMTGYCMAANGEEACSSQGDYMVLNEAIAEAAAAESVTLVDSTAACGGGASSWSPIIYFQDPIHLNNRGYCKVFTQSAVQTAFGCQETSYMCDTVTCLISGLTQHCGDSDMAECPGCTEYCTESGGDSQPSGGGGDNDDDHDGHGHDDGSKTSSDDGSGSSSASDPATLSSALLAASLALSSSFMH